MTSAKNPISPHFTISFHFLSFSSSPAETTIENAPKTTAPTAKSQKNPASADVHVLI